MRSPQFIEQMAERVRGIGTADQGNVRTPRINVRDLLGIMVPYASAEELARATESLIEATSRIEAMLAKVSELRVALMERSSSYIADVITGRKEVA